MAFGRLGGMGRGFGRLGALGGASGLTPPSGFVFLVDLDGAYLVDLDGAYLITGI